MLRRQHAASTSPTGSPLYGGVAARPRDMISDDPYPFYSTTTSKTPVFTFTASSFSASNILGDVSRQQDERLHLSRQRYPKVRQKSKSSGASPQKYPSPVEFNDEFINIITSSDSIDYGGDSCDLFCPAICSSSRSSNASARSYLSQQYVQRYGSNSKLLQVPSASSLLLPAGGSHGGRYMDDDDDEMGGRNRQQRSRSITVPIQHSQRSPERATQVTIRRCSSASPQGRYLRLAQEQRQHISKEVVKKSAKHVRQRERGFSITAATAYISSELTQQQHRVRRRRSSGTPSKRNLGYRRVSNHSIVTPYSTSTSSLSSSSSGSPKKEKKVISPYKRHRTLSMPSCGITAQLPSQLKKKDSTTPESPDSISGSTEKSHPKKEKKVYYDVVIIGSSNVGKASLAEYFSKGGSSGSDPGIGSDFEDDDDQDLCNGGNSILYKPKPDLKQPAQYDFTLRIFHQQNSAISHLYKFDAVLVMYSITDRESFQFAKEVLSEVTLKNNSTRSSFRLRRESKEVTAAAPRPRIVILVGNKTDLERSRTVTAKEGKYLATLHGCKFIEVSACLDLRIDSLMHGLMTQVNLRHQKLTAAHRSPAVDSGSSSTSVAISKSSSSSSSSASAANTVTTTATKVSSAHSQQQQQQRQRKKRSNSKMLALGAATSSFKLAQRLIDRLMSIRFSTGKSKSCLDLHSL